MKRRASFALLGILTASSRAYAQTTPVSSGRGSAEGGTRDDEVLIAGTRASHVGGSVQVVDKQKLERFEYDDSGAILQQVPGVYVRGEDGMGLRPNIGIRGANPDRSKKLTLMEDGILFGPAPYSAPAAYYVPLMTRMTQVRVIKGPAAIAYGPQTVGGAIDLVSRPVPRGGKPEGAVDLAAGEYGYGKLHAYGGWGDDKMGFLIEGVRLENTGFAQLPSGADTGSTRNDWMVKGAYTIDPEARARHRLQLKLSYGDEVSNETYLGQSDADFRTNPYRRYPASALDQMRNHRTGIVLSHTVDGPESSYKIETKAYRFDYARTWRKLNRLGQYGASEVLQNPTDPTYAGYYGVLTGRVDSSTPANTLWVGPNDRRFVSQGIQSVLSTRTMTGPVEHRFEAGIRFHYDEIRRLHTESAFLMSGGELVNANQPVLTTANNLDSTYALATHITDAMTWRALTVTPGARVEVISSTRLDRTTRITDDGFTGVVLPGVGAYYEITREIGALAGVHRGFSPPPPGSGHDVKPEYSVAYEAGARYTRGNSRLEVIGFVSDYSNLTDVCTLSSGCVATNLDRQFDAGKALIRGLEVYGAYEPRLKRYELRVPVTAAYTLTEGWFQNDFTSQDPIYGNVRKNDDIPYIPAHQLSVTGAVEHRYAGANLAVMYVSPMREVAGRGAVESALHTDEQLWADIGAYVAPLRWLKVYANWRNVFGGELIVGHRPYGARPNAPRWLQVGLKATF